MITKSQILAWIGSDNTLNEAINVLEQLANGDYCIEEFKQDIASYNEADEINIKWHIEDVLGLDVAEENNLTKEEARRVLYLAGEEHDANEGINWDVLEIWIKHVIDERS